MIMQPAVCIILFCGIDVDDDDVILEDKVAGAAAVERCA